MGRSGGTRGGGTDILDQFTDVLAVTVTAQGAGNAISLSDTPSDEAANMSVTDSVTVGSTTTMFVSGSVSNGAATGSLSGALPSGIADGDLWIIAWFVRTSTPGAATPTGFTAMHTSSDNRLYVWGRVKQSGDAAVALPNPGAVINIYTSFAVKNVNATWLDAVPTGLTGSGSAQSAPSITTVTNGADVIELFAQGANTGYTFERIHGTLVANYSATASAQLLTMQAPQMVAGATKPGTATGTAVTWVSASIALRPA